ncbi:MAG: M48 family metallopeptidase, partial [Lentisphaeraceae bacterium]|nr:M48 family metallopeptidase [Lentisphaeraceae bacterium]
MEFKIKKMGGGEHTSRVNQSNNKDQPETQFESNRKIQNFHFTEDDVITEINSLTEEEVAKFLDVEFEKVPLSFFYRVAMFFLFPIIVLIAGIYLTTLGGCLYTIHEFSNRALDSYSVNSPITTIILEALPAILALFTFFYFFLPLVRSLIPAKLTVVYKEDEPVFHRYINILCQKLNAKAPKEICVTMEVNAAVCYKHGFFSLFSDSTRLIIGLPLIEGMSVKQLTGILCHEIGHFAQGNARRATYILRVLYIWMIERVLNKSLYEKIIGRLYRPDRFIGFKLIGRILWLVVLVPKAVFAILAGILHLSSMFLLRQMEYNADLYEAQSAGSESFETTSLEMCYLNVSQDITVSSLQRSYKNNRLSDDMPGLIAASKVILSDKDKSEIHQNMLKRKGKISDTHPSTSKRIKNAMKHNYPGIIQSKSSARHLFNQLETYNKKITLSFYSHVIGKKALKKVKLIPNHDLLNEMRETYRGWRSLNKFFQGVLHFSMPYQFKGSTLYSNDKQAAISSLKRIRDKMEMQQNIARDAQKRYLSILEDKSYNSMARKLMTLGMDQYVALLAGRYLSTGDLTQFEQQTRSEMSKVQTTLNDFSKLAKQRIELALQLLNLEEFRKDMKHGNICFRNIEPILSNLKMMASIQMPLTNLENNFNAIGLLFSVGGQ